MESKDVKFIFLFLTCKVAENCFQFAKWTWEYIVPAYILHMCRILAVNLPRLGEVCLQYVYVLCMLYYVQ